MGSLPLFQHGKIKKIKPSVGLNFNCLLGAVSSLASFKILRLIERQFETETIFVDRKPSNEVQHPDGSTTYNRDQTCHQNPIGPTQSTTMAQTIQEALAHRNGRQATSDGRRVEYLDTVQAYDRWAEV